MVVVLPAFMLELGASKQLVALLPALYVLGAAAAGGDLVFRRDLATSVPMRLPWLALGLMTLWLARNHPVVVLLVLMVCFAVSHTSFGLSSPAYGELIAKTIPPHRRGMFMAYALKHFRLDDTVTGKFLVASTVATMVAALVMGWLGDRYGHKLNLVIACVAHGYVAAFLISAAICVVAASVLVARMRTPVCTRPPAKLVAAGWEAMAG